ncbi:MurR/RpiR family transcriptional regulator [Ureibacillus terrenus]|uniref:MurR/RpiR family transcriptional regulator n=2 Tax=Ureibacillus terrenus TaxID=118246 RepID=A0A540V110_9BACL|nr:MurR/RpiR family transcriptional regulator [Ureibacillus terrenus]
MNIYRLLCIIFLKTHCIQLIYMLTYFIIKLDIILNFMKEEFFKKMSFCDEVKKRFIRLSRGQRKVAQFVIDNPHIVATHIASEVGKIIGVSESTVIRFCYAMDLSGYSELQERLRKDLSESNKVMTKEETISVGKKHEYLFSEVMNRDVTSILNTIQYVDADHFQKAINYLHEAEEIYTLGFRQCSPSTSYLTSMLESLGKKTTQIQFNVEDIVKQMKKMDKNSLLFVIALDSVLEDILTIAKIAKNKKVKIIAITNSTVSPVRDYADVSFVVGTQKQFVFEVNTAANSIVHALVEGMILLNRNYFKNFSNLNTPLERDLHFLEEETAPVK